MARKQPEFMSSFIGYLRQSGTMRATGNGCVLLAMTLRSVSHRHPIFAHVYQHLIARAEGHSNEICFTSSAWNNLKLSLLDSELFHIPYSTSPQTTIPSQLPPNAAFLQTNHTVCIYPPGKAAVSPRSSRDIAFPSSIDAIQQAQRAFVREMPEYEASCSRAQEAIRADPRWSSGRTGAGDDITVTTLGTGSALPSKYRNVTCIHLDIPGVGSVLLDAGEGSLGQLRRRFGPDGVRHLYGNLRMIFISHMHADHHLGLQRILEDRFKVCLRAYLTELQLMGCRMASHQPYSLSGPTRSHSVCKNPPHGNTARHRRLWMRSCSSTATFLD